MAKPKCHNCEMKCGKGRLLPDIARKLDDGFKKLITSNSESLLKKYLTQDIFDKLKKKKTSFGATLWDCIQSGVANPDSSCGIYAPDPEAYTTFAAIFHPVIQDYHIGFETGQRQPSLNWGDLNSIENVDPTGKYVISTRIRCGRNVFGFPFNPLLTEPQYHEIADKMTAALTQLRGELEGRFYPLETLSEDERNQLIDDHYLFKEGDRFLQAANACRFWPIGRGIFFNAAKTFLVWVNEEDHVRIISMQSGGDIRTVYKRLVDGATELERFVPFTRNERFGYITFCPTNLGTTIRASVHIKLPKLAADRQQLEAIAGRYNLQVRGTRGEHSDAEDGIYDISNKRRLGLTEFEAVKEMNDGILEIIKEEQKHK